MGCHFLLQGIFLTQGLNLHFLHWQADSLSLSHQGSPIWKYLTQYGSINNHRYADDTTLTAESEEELKSLLMKVKEESEKAALKQHSQN